MRYAQIDKCEIVNGNGVGVSLYVQGCPIRCKGCFNPETGDFNGGEEGTFETEKEVINLVNKEYIKRFSIVGGEPLYKDNVLDLFLLVFTLKEFNSGIDIWLGTGYTGEQIQQRLANAKMAGPEINEGVYLYGLLKHIDYIVVGPFIEEQKDLSLLGRGSRNQEVIDVQQTLKNKEKVLYV